MSKSFILTTTVAIMLIAVSIGVPRYMRSHAKGSVSACVNNLGWINGLKEQWALEHTETTNTLTWDDLRPYMHGRTNYPSCPAGGTYTIGRRGEYPTCSIGTNVVPYHVLQY